MDFLITLTGPKRKIILIPLLMLSLTVAGCANLNSHSVTWPTNLEVIKLSDGGICLSPESAKRLAELRAEIESL